MRPTRRLTTGGGVEIGWRRDGAMLEIWIKDEGPGLSSTANLFVPFFTTKPGGSGIGLVLSRQIAEGHGGALTLENRTDGPGCVARLRLPNNAPTPTYSRPNRSSDPDGPHNANLWPEKRSRANRPVPPTPARIAPKVSPVRWL
jgi:hypothetical protein